jgi:hypothetical protein
MMIIGNSMSKLLGIERTTLFAHLYNVYVISFTSILKILIVCHINDIRVIVSQSPILSR